MSTSDKSVDTRPSRKRRIENEPEIDRSKRTRSNESSTNYIRDANDSEQDRLKACTLCNQQFATSGGRVPRLLPCLHAVCTECSNDRGEQSCRWCADDINLELKDTFPISAVHFKIALESAPPPPLECAECVDPTIAYRMCIECNALLCQDHTNVHPKTRATRDHQLKEIDASVIATIANSSSSSTTRESNSELCKRHPTMRLTHLCNDDLKVLCIECAESEDHLQHTRTSIGDASNIVGQHLREFKRKFQQYGVDTQTQVQSLEQAIDRTIEDGNNLNQCIFDHGERLKSLVDQLVHQLQVSNREQIHNTTREMTVRIECHRVQQQHADNAAHFVEHMLNSNVDIQWLSCVHNVQSQSRALSACQATLNAESEKLAKRTIRLEGDFHPLEEHLRELRSFCK